MMPVFLRDMLGNMSGIVRVPVDGACVGILTSGVRVATMAAFPMFLPAMASSAGGTILASLISAHDSSLVRTGSCGFAAVIRFSSSAGLGICCAPDVGI